MNFIIFIILLFLRCFRKWANSKWYCRLHRESFEKLSCRLYPLEKGKSRRNRMNLDRRWLSSFFVNGYMTVNTKSKLIFAVNGRSYTTQYFRWIHHLPHLFRASRQKCWTERTRANFLSRCLLMVVDDGTSCMLACKYVLVLRVPVLPLVLCTLLKLLNFIYKTQLQTAPLRHKYLSVKSWVVVSFVQASRKNWIQLAASSKSTTTTKSWSLLNKASSLTPMAPTTRV